MLIGCAVLFVSHGVIVKTQSVVGNKDSPFCLIDRSNEIKSNKCLAIKKCEGNKLFLLTYNNPNIATLGLLTIEECDSSV